MRAVGPIPMLGAMTRYLLAPLLLFSYGAVRLLDGVDGSHGPGPAWTVGHVLFLGALVTFGLVAVDLRRHGPAVPAWLALAGTFAGLAAFVHVVVVDLLVGFGAADRAEMNDRYADYETPLDPLAPLFPIGLTVLLLLFAIAHRRAYWSPILALLAFLTITADLDLLPIAALLLFGAVLPAARSGEPRRRPVGAAEAG